MPKLTHLLEKESVPHALLIVDGKKRALKFAEELVGSSKAFHPDVHHIYPEGKCHPIAALRQLTDDVSLMPYVAPYKVFIIHEAERMMINSSNALLKTFEEPSARTVIMLLTSYPEKLLPTILSRCQCYRYQESHEDEIRIKPLLDALAGGDIPEIEDADESCFEAIMKWYRDLYAFHLGVSKNHLFFPDRLEQYAALKPYPLDEVEELIGFARLGTSRSLKFSKTIDIIQKAMNML